MFNAAVHKISICYSSTWKPDGQRGFGYWILLLIFQMYIMFLSGYVNNGAHVAAACSHEPVEKVRYIGSLRASMRQTTQQDSFSNVEFSKSTDIF